MDESKRSAIRFLEKEIKTYLALSLFLSKKGIEEHVRIGGQQNPDQSDVLQRTNEGSEEHCH
jgi:hypothetical protein